MIDTLIIDFSRVLIFPKDSGYKGTLNDLYLNLSIRGKYNFWDNYRFNEELLGLLATLKDNITMAIFTSGTLQNDPEVRRKLNPIFKNIYSSKDLGMSKRDPSAYLYIVKNLGKTVENALFIDDMLENIVAAETAGLKGIQFESNAQAIPEIKRILEIKNI